MSKVFEDALMDVQSELISLCLEVVENRDIDKVYAYCSIEKKSMMFNAFFEAISGINVFYYLTTTSRDMLQASYERLGSLRAESAFGHPVYFAVYLLSMLPFALYFYENTAKKRYLLIGGLNICALFASGTRGGGSSTCCVAA